MQYAFILGRTPSLSLAELTRSVPGISLRELSGEALLADAPELPPGFLNLLGGTIKIIEITGEYGRFEALTGEVLRSHLPDRAGRVIFGISIYGEANGPQRRHIYMEGLNLKKILKAEGRRARYVVSKEKQLSSVVVSKNKLIEEGAELVLVRTTAGVAIGRTIAIQEFEEYGARDFDRPGRSAKRGMLPPKLAQMMINIAGGDKRLPLLDPFCGSGTVLGEGLLMGWSQVIGSDLSGEAATDSTAYLKWLEERHQEVRGRWKVHAADVRLLNKTITPGSVGSIAAEPFLGPPQTGHETPATLLKVMDMQLVPLYTDMLRIFSELLAPGAKACIALPIFGRGKNAIRVPIDEIKNSLTIEPLTKDDRTIHYERAGQHVTREIVLLSKP